MHTFAQLKEHLTGMGHGGTLNKVRNIEAMFERSASKFLLKNKPVTVIRTLALSSFIYDDVYNYALPDDFGTLVDLIPQDNRDLWDKSFRTHAGAFDVRKAIDNKTISIEGDGGEKSIRINWRSRTPQLLNAMDSLTANGTWSAVATAANLAANTIFKRTGNASVEFDIVTSGDGIKNTTMSAVDLTDADEVGAFFVDMYFATVPTSVSAKWGNDLTTKYWTSTAQTTQYDGTAFKVGWNKIKFSWSTATETGTVDPTAIDSFQVTVASVAQTNVRLDNIVCAIGRNFDIKYYSKFLFISASGTWTSRPSDDGDNVAIDNDGLPVFLFECLKDMAHQMEGTDSAFDMTYARQELQELFPHFRAENPNQSKKAIGSYGGKPRFRR